MFSHGFTTSGSLLILLGIAVLIFGLVADKFLIQLPGLQGIIKKPLPNWFGRLWFLVGGAVLIYLGISH